MKFYQMESGVFINLDLVNSVDLESIDNETQKRFALIIVFSGDSKSTDFLYENKNLLSNEYDTLGRILLNKY